MERLVILGAGQMGIAARNLLDSNNMELVAVGDNSPKKWDRDSAVKTLPVAEALAQKPDCVLICVSDEVRASELERQARESGYCGRILKFSSICAAFDLRAATFQRLADRIDALGVDGSIAELGVYRGDFARLLNARYPERRLYLFDTFEGFTAHDVAVEQEKASSFAKERDFDDTSEEYVLSRMPCKGSIVVKKGFFPETATGLEGERYALVSLDADLYAPTLAGLRYFYPRLNAGGAILLHDYNSLRFSGVHSAVDAFEEENGRLNIVPLSDPHGTAVILKPV